MSSRPTALRRRGSEGLRGAVWSVAALLSFAPGAAWAEEPLWATKRAEERTLSAGALVARGDGDGAIRQLNEAILFDSTYAPAYLALGQVEESLGHVERAEHAYTLGLDRATDVASLRVARARLRSAVGRFEGATLDLERALAEGAERAKTLAALLEVQVKAGMFPAALSSSRSLLALARKGGDPDVLAAEQRRARAIATLVRHLDPVTRGASGRGLVRSALARAFAGR